MDESVLWKLSYGLYAVGVNGGGKPAGCIVNTIFQVTSENPIVAMSINRDHYTLEMIQKERCFGVSILSEQTRPIVIGSLGFFSARDKEKFQGLDYTLTTEGIPLLKEHCCGYLICDLIADYQAETHDIVVARVRETCRGEDLPPMTYRYYHEVVKGKAPKSAPTYKKTEVQQKERYVCDVCGYLYEGDMGREKADYVCPVCGADRTHFGRVGKHQGDS